MAMNISSLAGAISNAFTAAHQTNTGSAPTAPQQAVINTIANSLATAIVTEVKKADITNPLGLTAGATPVTGVALLALS